MIFADHMVLQREKPISVWGEAAPGEKIRITLGGTKTETAADSDGSWRAVLPELAAAVGLELVIEGEDEKAVFSDVCIGEVWIAGGQSNMEYLLGFEMHFDEVAAAERNPLIRFFDYPEVAYEGQLQDFDYKNCGFWRRCTKEDLGWFSAVGYYFAKELQADLKVPVGIVGCNWGGTTASCWMDPEYLRGTAGEVWITDYENSIAGMDMDAYLRDYRTNPMNDRTDELHSEFSVRMVKEGVTREEQLKMMEEAPAGLSVLYERRPGGLYGTMLKKIVPYSARGVIWYQGESDGDGHAQEYELVFSKMIENWRALWGERLPFLFVQLAPFREWMMCSGKNYGIVRACQDAVSRKVPDAWMVTSGDAGMEWDIHPKNKKPIGERLALSARGHVYGEDVLCDAPEAVRAYRENGDVHIEFRYADGLEIRGGALNALQGVLEDGSTAELSEAAVGHPERDGVYTLIVRNAGAVKELRYGMTDYYEINLYNRSDFPAKPFSIKVEETQQE